MLILRDTSLCRHGYSTGGDPCVFNCSTSNKRDIVQLGRTCRFLHAIAQPHVWYSLTVDWMTWQTPQAQFLHSMLLARQDLRSFVRILTFVNVSRTPQKQLKTLSSILVEVRHVLFQHGSTRRSFATRPVSRPSPFKTANQINPSSRRMRGESTERLKQS